MEQTEQIIEKAKQLVKEEKYNEVILLLTDALLQKLNSSELYFIRGYAFLMLQNFDAAISDYTKTLELFPDSEIAYYHRAIALDNKGNYDKAIEDYTKAIEIKPDYASAYNNRGLIWSEKGDNDKAIEDYTKAIEIKPDYADAYYNRGTTWSNKGEYDKAIEDFTKAMEIKPDYADAYYNRGIAWSDKGDNDKAIEDYTKAIEIKPDYSDAYNGRGVAWYNKGDYDKAIEDYTKAIEIKPDYASAYNNRGLIWSEKSDNDKAIEDYTKAIEIKPDSAYAYNNRGNVWNDKGDHDKAIEDYTKAIEIKPDYADAYYNRGIAWSDKGEHDKAIEDYSTAIKIKPNYENAYYNRALAWSNKKAYDKAIADINEYLNLKPGDTDAIYLMDRYKALLGEKIDIDKDKSDEPFYLFYKIVEKLPSGIKQLILQKCDNVSKTIEKIREHTSNIKVSNVAHYTKLKVANIIISNENSSLRYYNAVYMNDPEEGKILLDCLNDNEINRSFENGKSEEESNMYIGSFLPAGEHEDELVMWRTYGKDEERNEAMGCSIVLKPEFFDKERKFLNPEMTRSQKIDSVALLPVTPQSLYSVIYFDKRERKFTGDVNDKIKNDVDNLKNGLKELLKSKNKEKDVDLAIDKIIYHILSEIRYFFKSADYAFENELRVIQFASPDRDSVKIDDNGTLPKRLYVESNKPVQEYIEKVILGPKVPHPEQWMYLEALMRKRGNSRMKVYPSICKFQ